MNIKELYKKHKDQIIPAVNLIRTTVGHMSEMREKSGIPDYIDLAFKFKDTYLSIYRNRAKAFFSSDDWEGAFTLPVVKVVVPFLQFIFNDQVTNPKSTNESSAYVLTVDGVKFGWHIDRNHQPDSFYIQKGKLAEGFSIIKQAFWNYVKSQRLILCQTPGAAGLSSINITEDIDNIDCIATPKAQSYVQHIEKFLSQEIGRSILFFGPPGSGKSNMVKSICLQMRLKTLRISDISTISNAVITEIIHLLDPDCIILEDIDHMTIASTADLLNKLETFNRQPKKIILATANQVGKLDHALIRPGRFDEVIEIKNVEAEVLAMLVNGDAEILELIKEFPVASAAEFMKRVKALGKEDAIHSIFDITERIANFDKANYKLRLAKLKKEMKLNEAEISSIPETHSSPQALKNAIDWSVDKV